MLPGERLQVSYAPALYLALKWCRYEAHTFALVGIFGDGTAKAFSVPGLKEIASADVSKILDIRRISETLVTPTGSVFGWTGPSELAALNVWGIGQDLYVDKTSLLPY